MSAATITREWFRRCGVAVALVLTAAIGGAAQNAQTKASGLDASENANAKASDPSTGVVKAVALAIKAPPARLVLHWNRNTGLYVTNLDSMRATDLAIVHSTLQAPTIGSMLTRENLLLGCAMPPGETISSCRRRQLRNGFAICSRRRLR